VTVELKLTSGSPVGITISPAKLEFVPGVTRRTFTIATTDDFVFEFITEYTLDLTLSGTDAAAFDIATTWKFEIESNAKTEAKKIDIWESQNCERTSCAIQPYGVTAGTVYYAYMYNRGSCLSLSDIQNRLIVEASSGKTTTSELSE
jgi:hypothetical protein